MLGVNPKLSIVAPVYNEAEGVRVFIDAVVKSVSVLGLTWELVLVNDGSSDDTLEIIEEMGDELPELRWVNLSRNFGHQAAVTAELIMRLGMPWW